MALPTAGPFAGLHIVDADSHYSEPHDLWTSRAPARYVDDVPQVHVDGTGQQQWMLGDQILSRSAGGASFIDKAGHKLPMFSSDIMASRSFSDIHEASYDVDARLAMLDDLGIWAQVVYPNVLGFTAAALVQTVDQELAALVVAIYNDAMAELQDASGERLFPQAVLPFWDIAASVREARRIAGLGLRGITMAGNPHMGGLPDLGQPDWDPLYEVLSELGLPINIHVAADNYNAHALFDAAWPSIEARAKKPINSVQMEIANSRFVSNLVLSDVLLKWPTLKWVSVESGIGWIPYVLERVDYEYREQFPDVGWGEPDRPTAAEMFRRNIYGCFWFEQAGPTLLLDGIGVDNVMWESDFPHPTCLYPSPVERTAAVLGDLDRDVVRKIMQDNAATLYRIPLPAA